MAAHQSHLPREGLRIRERIEAIDFHPAFKCRCRESFETVEGAVNHVEEIHLYEFVKHGAIATLADNERAVAAMISPRVLRRTGNIDWNL